MLRSLIVVAALLVSGSTAQQQPLQANTAIKHGPAAITSKLTDKAATSSSAEKTPEGAGGPETKGVLTSLQGIDMTKSNLFCVDGEPVRWMKTGVHPSALSKASWCAHTDGVCCALSGFCCPNGYQCTTGDKPTCFKAPTPKAAVKAAEPAKGHFTYVENENTLVHGKAAIAAAAKLAKAGGAPAPAKTPAPSSSDESSEESSSEESSEASSEESSESSGAAAESSSESSSASASGADTPSMTKTPAAVDTDANRAKTNDGDGRAAVNGAVAHAIRKLADSKQNGAGSVILSNSNHISQVTGTPAAGSK